MDDDVASIIRQALCLGCNPTFPNFDGDPIPDLGFLPDDCDACGAGNTNIDACGVGRCMLIL
jgi:hypothetical protein